MLCIRQLPNRTDWIAERARGKVVLNVSAAVGDSQRKLKAATKKVVGIDVI